MNTKILLVDDEARILQTFARTLRLAGYTVVTAQDGETGLALYHQEEPDIVLLDLRMPGMDGLTVLEAIREDDPEANVILCTAHGDKDAVIDALRAGASDFLPKPVDQVTLESALRRAEERIHLKRELRASQEALRRHNERLEEEVEARTAELEREIEERKRTEAALRESEARERARAADLEAIMDAVSAVIWIARDPECQHIDGNPASYRMLGMEEGLNTSLTPGDGQPVPDFKLFHRGEEISTEELPMQKACREGVATRNYELDVVFDDGRKRTLFGNTVPLRGEEGRIQGAVAAYVDITTRKRMEEALSFQALLLDKIEDMVTATDLNGNIIYVNDAEVRRLKRSREELLDKPVEVYGEDPSRGPTQQEIVENTLENGEWRGEVVNYTADGEEVVLDCRTRLLRDRDGEPTSMVGIATDVTERKQTEDALRESEERLRRIVEGTKAMLVNVDQRGRITYANDAAATVLGQHPEDLIGELYLRFVHPDDRDRVGVAYREQLKTGAPSSSLEFRILADGGDVRWVNFVAHPIEGAVQAGLALDITERKQMEAALRESEKRLRRYADQLQRMVDKKVRQLEQERTRAIQLDKLAALGQMAAGVAHELNQPLAAIRFEADYLVRMGVQSQVEHGGDLNAMLDPAAVCEIGEEVKEDLDRCRRLIDHLRDFGRISQEPPAPVSLNEPIEDSFILVGARLRSHDVDVQLDLDPDLPPTMAHRYRLEQVFLNLISNAEYAMDQRAAVDPGFQKVLEITTGAVGDDVIATVRDNGCGMPDDMRERIFDPFFTTKPRGEGTGLGLSISYGIVADYDGEITCYSAEGQGTTFTLRFPAADS